ncbi:MAG: putative zinc-binding metallopeptidase [Pseudomonadales bacterium]
MKTFYCQVCGQMIFFDNAQCLRCGSQLGYLPDQFILSALESCDESRWRSPDGSLYRKCANTSTWQVCNWMIPAASSDQFCVSCSLNETIPDLSQPENLDSWRKLEQGKRRLVYNLQRLGLPVISKKVDPVGGLAFEFLKELDAASEEERVRTGHINGTITVNIVEADDLQRELTRLNLNEAYRSILGHFRHESGHYYWWRFVNNSTLLEPFRALFGDERTDYKKSISAYYTKGPSPNWQSAYVSAYASSHPWEDWAECWSHYLTIIDALETAQAHGVVLARDHSRHLFTPTDSYRSESFDEMLEEWLPLTYAINSINRSAGQNDLYPFVLPGPAVNKLRFVHRVVKQGRSESSPA